MVIKYEVTLETKERLTPAAFAHLASSVDKTLKAGLMNPADPYPDANIVSVEVTKTRLGR